MICPFEGLDGCDMNYDESHYGMSSSGLVTHIWMRHRHRLKWPIYLKYDNTFSTEPHGPFGFKTTIVDADMNPIFESTKPWKEWFTFEEEEQ